MIIESFRKFGEFRKFSPETGEIGSQILAGGPDTKNYGQYYPLGQSMGVLYRADDQLWLWVGADKIAISRVRDASTTRLESGRSMLSITVDGHRYSWEYELSADIESGVTSFATFGEEDEDFDFGLFVTNVAKDPARQERLYSYWWLKD